MRLILDIEINILTKKLKCNTKMNFLISVLPYVHSGNDVARGQVRHLGNIERNENNLKCKQR